MQPEPQSNPSAPEAKHQAAPTPQRSPAVELKSGVVCIAGRPNSGKSTLLNRIVGSRLSVVSAKAQTTRDRLKGILTNEKGQIIFVDTPGIHTAKGEFNKYMVDEARGGMEAVDLIWYLVDPRSELKHEEVVLKIIKASGAPVMLLMNKADINRNTNLEEAIGAELGPQLVRSFFISALKDRGLPMLEKKTWQRIKTGPLHFPEDDLSDRPMRYFASEAVREQLLKQLGDEIPYCCAVFIESFKENAKPIRIEASIIVERDSQKGMVIGKGGQKIKAIGEKARGQIERLIDQKIFLGLKVKVIKDWTRNKDAMRRLGYEPAKDSHHRSS